MSYTIQHCETCDAVIDPDDPDFHDTVDHPELCGACNEAYRETR